MNLVPNLDPAVHGMQHERLPTADRQDPTHTEVAAIRNPWNIPHYLSSHPPHWAAPRRSSRSRRTLPPELVSAPTFLKGSPDTRTHRIPFRSYWKNGTLQRKKHYWDYGVRIWFMDENFISLRFQIAWSHTLQVCASSYWHTVWEACMCVYIYMYIHTLVYLWRYM